MNFSETSTTYTLMSSAETGKRIIETHTIQHTACEQWKDGYILGLYFGGECPAPQEVGICYQDFVGPNGPTSGPTEGPSVGPSPSPSPTFGPTDLPGDGSFASSVFNYSFISASFCVLFSLLFA